MTKIVVRTVQWSEAETVIRPIREAVFIVEQGVPVELEWDGLDADCCHTLAWVRGPSAGPSADGPAQHPATPVGTARLRPDGHLGRMAVLAPWRRQGIGTALLHALIQHARWRGLRTVHLAAQTHAVGFYERHGFAAWGAQFMDAGIPHRNMRLSLTAAD